MLIEEINWMYMKQLENLSIYRIVENIVYKFNLKLGNKNKESNQYNSKRIGLEFNKIIFNLIILYLFGG